MSFRYIFLTICFCSLFFACSSSTSILQHQPELTFKNLPMIHLNIKNIEVTSNFNPPDKSLHIEYAMPISLENSIGRWAKDRLHMIGNDNTLRVVIRDASVIATPLHDVDTSLTGILKKKPINRIDMSIDVSLQILDNRKFVIAEVIGNQLISRTEFEGMTQIERNKMLYDMVNSLITGYNTSIDKNIHDTFDFWIERNH
ncbi:MAG: hypothetical protein LBS66_01320 [Rhodospirillaceae bacterium]|jgi:hypothetical protein|nr:hypothetical protein [Rhodospirillaceae bacterium]